MRIGYYVQGDNDEALIWGLAQRWCPKAERAPGKFRGSSGVSFRREIRNALVDLKDDKGCDILVVLTDADVNPWREVKRREWQKVPLEYQHLTVFGVADRNVECWLAIDRQALATELQCQADDIPHDDPSGFIKRRLGYTQRGADKQAIKERVRDFVGNAPLRTWIEDSDSFEDFYQEARRLSQQTECAIPNELERT
jgi:hypothetical protein